jgi:hypothetical protein
MLKLFLVVSFFINCKVGAVQQQHEGNKAGNKKIEKFDIKAFDKHQQDNSYEFDGKDDRVMQFSYQDGYVEEITYPDKLFKLTKDFYKNGYIKQKGLEFIKGGFMKGTWQFYDASGNLTHETNYDSWYKFSWEDVQHFLQMNNATMPNVINITRTWKEGEKRVWVISYKATPDKNGNFIRTVKLNGETGKIDKDEWTKPQRH